MYSRVGSRSRWAAVGAVATMLLGGGTVLTASAATPSTISSFVPITPCRLLDTRPAEQVGPRGTPLGPVATHTATVWGTNGNCTIPAGSTGFSMNVVVVNPTAASFLTVFPADETLPLASSLNWVAGQAATPNSVTVAASADGKISFYNSAGDVDLAVDIVGYYVAGTDAYTKAETDTALAGKANVGDSYTKAETDTALAGKANVGDSYTKAETETLIDGVAPIVYSGRMTGFAGDSYWYGPPSGVGGAATRQAVEMLSPPFATTLTSVSAVTASGAESGNFFVYVNGSLSDLGCHLFAGGCSDSGSYPVPANSKVALLCACFGGPADDLLANLVFEAT